MNGKIHIGAGAVLLLSALYYLRGLGSLAALLAAAAVHEAGHIAALRLYRIPIKGFCFTAEGMRINVGAVSDPAKQILCYACGPAAGIVFACIASGSSDTAFFSEAAGVSLALSLFNLLPVLPLDGGRILSCLLCDVFRWHGADGFMYALGMTTAVAVTLAGLGLLRHELGIAVFFAGIYLVLSMIRP